MSKTGVFLGATAIVLIGLYLLFPFMPFDVWGAASPALPIGTLSRSQVFSNVVGPLSAIVAFIALLVNFDSSNRTALQTVRTEQAARYQKAVELIGNDKNTSKVAGVVLLEGLARENPATYREPTAGTLAAAISEIDGSFKDRCSLFKIDSRAAYKGKFPSASYASYEMMAWFGSLRQPRVDDWPREFLKHLGNGRFPLLKPYLEDSTYDNFNFSRTDIERAVLKDAHFVRCNLANASWSFSVGGTVTFVDCDMRDARFKIWDGSNRRLWTPTDLVTVRGGRLDGLEINGLPLSEWQNGQKLPDEVVAKWNSAPPIVKPSGLAAFFKRHFNG